jgi:hypothetical protein
MLTVSNFFYRLLLRAYPADHRRAYGKLMAQLFRDLCKDAYAQRGVLGLIGLWLYTLADTFANAFIEHRATWKKRLSTQSPITYDLLHVALVMIPLVAIIIYIYAAQDSRDMPTVYLLILITGAIAWVLNRLGLMPLNPIWNMYMIGILLGVGSIIFFFLSSIPAFGVYLLRVPPIFILVASFVIYIFSMGFSARFVGGLARSYLLMAMLLAITTGVGFLVSASFTPNPDDITRFISFNYSLMQTGAALLTTAVSLVFVHRWGKAGLIPLMLGIGVQFIWIDPGYYTGYAGRWIDLCLLLFPLAICPAWWLLARSRRSQVRGTLLLWGILMGIAAFAPGIARAAMGLEYEVPMMSVYRAFQIFPYFAAMWLALRVWNSGADHPITQNDKAAAPSPNQPATAA